MTEKPQNSDLVSALERLITQWRVSAKEAGSDGDFCCEVTREHDATDLEAVLAGVRAPQAPDPARP